MWKTKPDNRASILMASGSSQVKLFRPTSFWQRKLHTSANLGLLFGSALLLTTLLPFSRGAAQEKDMSSYGTFQISRSDSSARQFTLLAGSTFIQIDGKERLLDIGKEYAHYIAGGFDGKERKIELPAADGGSFHYFLSERWDVVLVLCKPSPSEISQQDTVKVGIFCLPEGEFAHPLQFYSDLERNLVVATSKGTSWINALRFDIMDLTHQFGVGRLENPFFYWDTVNGEQALFLKHSNTTGLVIFRFDDKGAIKSQTIIPGSARANQ